MNRVELTGRLTREPDVRYGGQDNQTCIARFALAVDRNTKDGGADYPSIKVLGKRAEWAQKYLRKGSRIEVCGRIQTGSYDSNGTKVYYTEILADEVNFGESKTEAESRGQSQPQQQTSSDGFMNIPDGIDEGLPFD